MESRADIGGNLRRVRERIDAACRRAGRDPGSVTLIAVSKKKPTEDILEACAEGATDFGENYVQELTEKIRVLEENEEAERIRWHMIGHLQKNKVKALIGMTELIHSVDSIGLAEQIEKEAAKQGVIERILLEVNIAGEESKWGFKPGEVIGAAREILALPHVRVMGVMTSAPYTEDGETNRGYFRELKALAAEMKEKHLVCVEEPVVSMGMSCDYETAVEEGATMVRVGTEIFGER